MSSILYAAYGININAAEMKRKFNACLVGKGYLENFDLEFRGFPSIKPIPGMTVPVVIWQLPEKAQTRLDYDEFINVGEYWKEHLEIKLEAFTDYVINNDLPRDEVKALVYVPKVFATDPLMQLSLTTYNIMFQAYTEQHHFDTGILVRAALAAKTRYEEQEVANYDRQQELLKNQGYSEEEFEILYYNLIARLLLNINPVKNSPNS